MLEINKFNSASLKNVVQFVKKMAKKNNVRILFKVQRLAVTYDKLNLYI